VLVGRKGEQWFARRKIPIAGSFILGNVPQPTVGSELANLLVAQFLTKVCMYVCMCSISCELYARTTFAATGYVCVIDNAVCMYGRNPTKYICMYVCMYQFQEVDAAEIIYTRFNNLISSEPSIRTLLPLSLSGIESEEDEVFKVTTKDGKMVLQKQVKPYHAALYIHTYIY